MRDWRDILNLQNLDAKRVQRANRGLTTRARAADLDFQVLDTAFCAARPAVSAATCAANGVDLREPLKPAPPDDAQDNALP